MHTARIIPEEHKQYCMFSLWIVLAYQVICSGTIWLEVKWIKLINEQLRTWRFNRALKKKTYTEVYKLKTLYSICTKFRLQLETAQGTRRTYWVGSITGRPPCGYISMACKYVDIESFLNWSFICLCSHADTATSKEENSLSSCSFWYKDISDDSEFWQKETTCCIFDCQERW
jgi:hypothetical protein